MTNDLETKATAVMLAMCALKGDLQDAPLDKAMEQRERIEEIVGLGNILLLKWQSVDEARDDDGMDEINLLREAGL